MQSATDRFSSEVRARFGVLPNFFCTASTAPALMEELWGFAKSAYLDSPLPSLFKERLFVQLSRFCEIRYCIVRHVGFLVGNGRPAGDAAVAPQTIEQVIALLRRPVPDGTRLNRSLSRLESFKVSIALPEPESELESAIFDALTIVFLSPRGADRARLAIMNAVGEPTCEVLVAFLAFVRTAHYWTETHPELGYESDMVALMQSRPDLATLMLNTAESDWAQSAQALRRALEEVRSTSGALRTSEERYRALVTATCDILYSMSPDWSEMRMLDGRGFLADTTSPDPGWMSRYVPTDEQRRVAATIQEAIAAKTLFQLEHSVIRKDGATGCVLSRAAPVLDDSGDVVEWVGAAIDLTERRIAEDALRRADRRKDEFLATLAHELRNPLAPLRSGLQLARLQGPLGEPLTRTLGMMERQVNLLAHLVDDLLDVSRITSGKIQLRPGNVKVGDVIAASAEASRAIVDAHNHILIVGPCDDEFTVYGDFDRLTQVFSNLLSNAAKYTENGGRIEVHVRREEGEVVVTVTDTGIGIPANALSAIFEMFSQVRTHQGLAGGGLGIGLTLVRQLIEMHGGSVAASSRGLNEGSTLTVRLPLAAHAAEAVLRLPLAVADLGISRPRRVLVVDDNEDAATSLAMLLQSAGHDVMTAIDGQDGVAGAVQFRPDVVLLDLGMPNVDGFEAASRMRALPGGSQLTLVALTGWGQECDLKRTRAAGFDHHLLKPVDFRTLSQLLERAH